MTISEAKEWVRDAAQTMEFDRCVGQDEVDKLHKEAQEIIAMLDAYAEVMAEL